jgi:hypothetical protein
MEILENFASPSVLSLGLEAKPKSNNERCTSMLESQLGLESATGALMIKVPCDGKQ